MRPFLLILALAGLVAAGCAKPRKITPLAVEIGQSVAARAGASCDDVEANYRIAQGVRTALEIPKYRRHILQELPGWSSPSMKLSEARALSSRSAKLLRDELANRCPKNRITGREDIVYIPS